MELDKEKDKNDLLKENIFLLFLSVITKIPYIIIGKPGSLKRLSVQLISQSMRGKYSKDTFFKKFPLLIQTYYQGSESSKPEDKETLFEIAENKLKYYINNKDKQEELTPISMVLFDELNLAERSKSNPLKVLRHKLEYNGNISDISFVGISNYLLNTTIIN